VAIPVFVLNLKNEFTLAVTFFFFTQNFNKMFILVGEHHDFTDVSITSSCQNHKLYAM